MHTLRFRQVHLDFHTSGHIPGVGEKFDKRQFQEALKRGHVNSITLFSKCHHGFSYHTTKVGRTHPTLRRDLLAEQIDACREIDVRCPIYLSAGLDELSADAHPEWVVTDRDGKRRHPLQGIGWQTLRFNSAYLDYLCDQIHEVVTRWPDNDGIFLDIISPWVDYSAQSLGEMKALGLNPEREEDADEFAQHVLLRYYTRANATVRSVRADTPVFHNGGNVPVGAHRFNLLHSHFELESLPTGGWGYDHFPFSARYAITQPRDFLGMTGKFHTSWGEFGGFKRPAALQYECAAMIANAAKCSVGDQLHPSGEMNLDTYDLIGAAYAEVEVKEPWVGDVKSVARIAIVSTERNQNRARGHDVKNLSDEGAARMLLELHQPFVVLDEHADWSVYELVILPDGFLLDASSLAKACAHLASGGKILAAGSALLNESRDAFALDVGATLLGRSAFDPDYLVATDLTPDIPVRSPIMIEGGAYSIQPTSARTLADRRNAYFNRTWEHFCSHQHTPDSPEATTPAAIFTEAIAYFAHDLFSQYRRRGQPLYRDFFKAALHQLLSQGLPVRTNLPTVARFNVLHQPAKNRLIAHLLYAPITLRAQVTIWGTPKPTEIIEELIPLRDTRVTLRVSHPVSVATLEPQGTPLTVTHDGDLVTFTVPEFTGHQMIVLQH